MRLFILGVVAGHFDLPNLAGSVLALFVVSGMSFGRYLVPQVRQSGTVTPIARLVGKIAVPAILSSIAVNLAFRLPRWPGMLLANNLVSPNAHVSGIGFWYIDVLVQCFVVLGVLLAIPPIGRVLTGDDPFYVLLGATLLFVGIAVAAPYVHDLSHLAHRTPVQFLRAVFLGWTLLHAGTLPRKLLGVALSIPVFGDIAWYHEQYVVFPFAATIFLAFVQRVSLPVVVGRVVTIIASASLFIYLTDHQVQLVLEKVGLGRFPIAMVGVATVVGIAAWKLWDRALSLMPRTIRTWL